MKQKNEFMKIRNVMANIQEKFKLLEIASSRRKMERQIYQKQGGKTKVKSMQGKLKSI